MEMDDNENLIDVSDIYAWLYLLVVCLLQIKYFCFPSIRNVVLHDIFVSNNCSFPVSENEFLTVYSVCWTANELFVASIYHIQICTEHYNS